jgi:hypothetical protein
MDVTPEITPFGSPKRALHLPPWHIPLAWRPNEYIRATRKRQREEKRDARIDARKDRKAAKRASRPQAQGRRELPRILRAPRMLALLVLSGCLVLTLVTSIAESWRDLYEWGRNHALSPFWANGVPLMVDTFIVVGEAALLVMAIDGIRNWTLSARAWAVFLFGLSVSLVGNVGHLRHANISTRGTSALPPLAAAISLSIALGMVKMIASYYDREPEVPAGQWHPARPEPAPAPVPAAPAAPPEPDAPSDLWSAEVLASMDHRPTSILVPPVAHEDKVAHPVAHDGAPDPDGPNVAHRPVNGASRTSGASRSTRVVATDDMVQAARQYLARLRRDHEQFPSDRKLAESHFNPSGEPGKGNRRAAQRVLAEYREAK